MPSDRPTYLAMIEVRRLFVCCFALVSCAAGLRRCLASGLCCLRVVTSLPPCPGRFPPLRHLFCLLIYYASLIARLRSPNRKPSLPLVNATGSRDPPSSSKSSSLRTSCFRRSGAPCIACDQPAHDESCACVLIRHNLLDHATVHAPSNASRTHMQLGKAFLTHGSLSGSSSTTMERTSQ